MQELAEKQKEQVGEDPTKHFAYGYGFYKLFWIFFIGSIAGVVVETIYCLIVRGHFESRVGVIFGPFNPVYGFGAVLLSLCLHGLKKRRDTIIFLGSMLIGGVFEYLVSVIQENVFGTVSWEYSHTQFNFAGRTNVMYALFWGVLGVLWVKDIEPFLDRQIAKIPTKMGRPLTWLLVVFMVFDMGISAMAVARQSQRRLGVEPKNGVEVFLDQTFPDSYLKKVYPNMMIVERGEDQVKIEDPFDESAAA